MQMLRYGCTRQCHVAPCAAQLPYRVRRRGRRDPFNLVELRPPQRVKHMWGHHQQHELTRRHRHTYRARRAASPRLCAALTAIAPTTASSAGGRSTSSRARRSYGTVVRRSHWQLGGLLGLRNSVVEKVSCIAPTHASAHRPATTTRNIDRATTVAIKCQRVTWRVNNYTGRASRSGGIPHVGKREGSMSR